MKNYSLLLETAQKTALFGVHLGKVAEKGDVICLDGDLGAGKTTLAQSIAIGLDVADGVYVSSPSFAILHEYPGRLPIYHMDYYRLHDCTEVEDLGFDEYIYGQGVCIIEWSLRAAEILPADSLRLTLEIEDTHKRRVTCVCKEDVWHKRLQSVIKQAGITET
ncbi:tRNA (adenosine(37)-N6)-threonylcarbamoyltransferase complex ATPase subunit type 1 TsaE [Desulfopila sp. IMCC35008]|uniref:tRNA (adenosine(37)-N6)-threonylcarbamoyltransferase complex ATPase subunit type 1 TsaE n=1 Tax=Desulfopila sp. IMCC35008 TaxID=2653858 RepID=UPI0013D4D865|nr:tRNA (adenosine(37)-N6)-threonylcarbamoyltransferase complex ATPase subunit type 1 TsaE [Desulfopila sp. IMCC35008]